MSDRSARHRLHVKVLDIQHRCSLAAAPCRHSNGLSIVHATGSAVYRVKMDLLAQIRSEYLKGQLDFQQGFRSDG